MDNRSIWIEQQKKIVIKFNWYTALYFIFIEPVTELNLLMKYYDFLKPIEMKENFIK